MSIRAFLACGVALAVSTSIALAASRFRDKPPDAHTGGFGEPICTACHLPENAERPARELKLTGLPPNYERGRTYLLTVELSAPSLQVGGFQLAARFAEGNQRGRQAGQFRATPRIQVSRVDSTGIQYVQHRAESLGATRDTIRWTFEWVAPAGSGDPVVFHFVANASDDDASPLGDRILTGLLTIPGTRMPSPNSKSHLRR